MTTPVVHHETFWSTIRRIGSSRKGVAAIMGSIIGLLYAFALTVSYFQGKMSPDAYWTKLQITGGVVSAAWLLYIPSTAYEDGHKNQPTNIQAAEGSNVQINPVPGAGGGEAVTDPQTPSAKQDAASDKQDAAAEKKGSG